jgi:hypothetical protein
MQRWTFAYHGVQMSPSAPSSQAFHSLKEKIITFFIYNIASSKHSIKANPPIFKITTKIVLKG